MLKKWLTVFLAAALAVSTCAGCTPAGTNNPNTTEIPIVQNFELDIYSADGCGMVAAGKKHSVGLRSDGTLISTGNNENGQCNVDDWEKIIHIDASDTMTVGASWEGKAYSTSLDETLQSQIAAWTDIVMITAGDAHVVGLKNDGTVVAAGDNSYGQCDVTAWTDIVMIAADANHTVALKKDGTVVAVGDNSSRQCLVSDWEKVVKIDTARYHTLALKEDGTAYAVGSFDLEQINVAGWHKIEDIYAGQMKSACMTDIGYFDCAPIDTDIMGVNDGVMCALGTNHAIFMKKDGTVATTGLNNELQCQVDGWMLRPYFVYGALAPGTTVEQLISIMTPMIGSSIIVKSGGAIMSAEQKVHTGCEIYTGSEIYAPVVIIGDADGDGAITEEDAVTVEKHLDGSSVLSGAYLTAAMVYREGEDVHEASVQAIRDHVSGEKKIPQFSVPSTNEYGEKIEEVKQLNDDIAGWIKIDGTDIDHPIMYHKEHSFYNTHDYLGDSSEHGSVYTFYGNLTKNNVITAHNMRKAKTNRMFHDLHHVQEYNMGETECQTKYCSDALTDALPDFSTYGGRVWTISIHGLEAQWEIFSMYETYDGEDELTLYNNVWWPNTYRGATYWKETDEEIQEWIDYQLERSDYEFSANPTIEDLFITLVTCGTEYDHGSGQSRLYIFLKKL